MTKHVNDECEAAWMEYTTKCDFYTLRLGKLDPEDIALIFKRGFMDGYTQAIQWAIENHESKK
jgi:hypothetical protein